MAIASLIARFRRTPPAISARVRTSSCRGYVVELVSKGDKAPRMLRNFTGGVVHFRSLDRVRDALLRRGIHQATLTQHHACEELSALGVSRAEEIGVRLFTDVKS